MSTMATHQKRCGCSMIDAPSLLTYVHDGIDNLVTECLGCDVTWNANFDGQSPDWVQHLRDQALIADLLNRGKLNRRPPPSMGETMMKVMLQPPEPTR